MTRPRLRPIIAAGHQSIARFARLASDCEGATAVEYGLLVGIISLSLMAASASFGNRLVAVLGTIANNLAGG